MIGSGAAAAAAAAPSALAALAAGGSWRRHAAAAAAAAAAAPSRGAALSSLAAPPPPWRPPRHHAQAAAAAAVAAASRCRRAVWNEPLPQQERRAQADFYDATVEKYALMPLQTLSLEQMLAIGRNVLSDPSKVVQSARFVHEELPKRLARRLLDLQLLPHLVVSNPHIRRVYDAYHHGFTVLRLFPPVKDAADNAAFCALLRRLVDEHAPLLEELAAGLAEVKARRLVGPALRLDAFLDAMLRSRISRRVMAEQHLHIASTRPGFIGSIATALDVADAVEFAGQRAAQICTETYGLAPEVAVSGDLAARLPYLPGHLDYILYELLKNAMRAVVERHRGATYATRSRRLPPIAARICAGGSGHLTIRLSDQGGGLPERHLADVWSYGWTTSASGHPDLNGSPRGGGDSSSSGSGSSSSGGGGGNGGSSRAASGGGGAGGGMDDGEAAAAAGAAADRQQQQQEQQQQQQQELHPPPPSSAFGAMMAAAADAPRRRYSLAGLGFGLPVSRLYARYFGGDLQLVNLPGYGVDAFVKLTRLVGEPAAGWREQHDGDDDAAEGARVAVNAALRVQEQLQQQGQRGSGDGW